MPLPQSKRSRVGCQVLKVYPWNGAAGPYDDTTVSEMFGIQFSEPTKNSKSAYVKGGESVHVLGAYEVDRETKVKFSAEISDLRIWSVLLGGTFLFDPANPPTVGEVQYFAEELGDRAPYVRLFAQSTNGDGTDSVTFFKARLDGPVNFKWEREKVTDLEFEVMLVWDYTAQRKDGKTGGLTEWLYGEKGETDLHS